MADSGSRDQGRRNEALDIGRSFIVQAPAGSGKTELLTQRFLKLLATVDKPERVLAITFTRKATQEMRGRILGRIRQAAEGAAEAASGYERVAVEFAAVVRQRDRTLGWDLVRNPGRLQIHTIDGLCARIAGMIPATGGRIPGLRIEEDARALYRTAARRMIEDVGNRQLAAFAYPSLTRLLVHLQGDAERLGDLVAAMLGRREQWLSLTAGADTDHAATLHKRQGEELACLGAVLGEASLETLLANLMALCDGAGEAAADLHADLSRSRQEPGDTNLQVLACWRALAAISTTACEPFAARSLNSRVLPGGGGERRARCIEALQPLVSAWRDDALAKTVFKRFVKTPPLGLDAGQSEILSDCIVLLQVAEVELQHLFAEANQSDFQYLAEMAMQALGREDQPGDALLYADYRLSHILMDEFQDTSHAQYKLLRRLTSGWQPDDGRTLFLVGDPMQSIYRFRKADVSLFKQVFASGRLGGVRLQALRLSSNFRSSPQIIDWVNTRFEQIFKTPIEVSPGAVAYTPVNAERDTPGRVVAHPWPQSLGPAHEAALVADLIAAQQLRRPGASIAVLARGRKHLQAIAAELKKRRIGYEAVQAERLAERPVVQDLLLLLRAMLHPLDRIAWLGLLRAPWVGLTPAQMHAFAGTECDMLASMQAAAESPGLDEALARRVRALAEVMAEVMNARGRVPLHRLAEVAWIRLKGPYTIGARPELDNAQSFFRLLAQVEAAQPDDLLGTLLERMENFFAGSIASDVQLMTIHAAKGLEFDVVIVPGMHLGRGMDRQVFLRAEEFQFGDGSDGVLMAPLRSREEDTPGLYGYLQLLNREQEDCEASRVLYVAATRARQELHLFGGWKMTGSAGQRKPGCPSGTFMALLWPFFEEVVDAQEAGEAEAGTEEAPLLPFLRLENEPPLALEPVTPELQVFAGELRLPDREAVAFGSAVHLWLELLHDHPPDHWSEAWLSERRPALRASLVNAGADAASVEVLCGRLEAVLNRVMTSAQGREIVEAAGKTASWAELAFYSRDGVQLRKHVIDRLYQREDGRFVIVDYKTGEESGESRQKWQAQLERYRQIVADCTDGEVSEAKIFTVK